MKKVEEKKRGDAFCQRISTAVWKEVPDSDNPFQIAEARCHGYEHLALVNNGSFSDVLFLLMKGELPNPEQSLLFDKLLISIIHPGPRHNASRAAMNAAVTKTNVSHVIPLALNVFSGEFLGSHEVFNCMKYLERNIKLIPSEVAADALERLSDVDGDKNPAPGFGTVYGDKDPYSQKLADNISSTCETGKYFSWACLFANALSEENCGWRMTGLFAAGMKDLGFTPYEGEMIFQIGSAPGIAAQAAEKFGRPITDMPFIPEENYVIE